MLGTCRLPQLIKNIGLYYTSLPSQPFGTPWMQTEWAASLRGSSLHAVRMLESEWNELRVPKFYGNGISPPPPS